MVNEESRVFHQTHLPTLIFLTAFGSRERDYVSVVCASVSICLIKKKVIEESIPEKSAADQFPAQHLSLHAKEL